jgi:hypothetical protein
MQGKALRERGDHAAGHHHESQTRGAQFWDRKRGPKTTHHIHAADAEPREATVTKLLMGDSPKTAIGAATKAAAQTDVVPALSGD